MYKKFKRTAILGMGLAGGLLYGFGETILDRYALGKSKDLTFAHDLIELSVPVLIGITLAFVLTVYFQQKELNRKLSGEMINIKSKILTNTFASYILHEIRNPIHNLNAVLEKHSRHFPDTDREVMERNMNKLTAITDQLKHMHVLADHMNVTQVLDFSAWIEGFIKDSIETTLRKNRIKYEQNLSPVRLGIHPLLLEQCLQLLFDNAIRVAKSSTHPYISLAAYYDPDKKGQAKIILQNSGLLFPEEVLQAGGRSRSDSREGSGLGLVLVRDTLKHVGGDMVLENKNGYAQVTLYVPREGAA